MKITFSILKRPTSVSEQGRLASPHGTFRRVGSCILRGRVQKSRNKQRDPDDCRHIGSSRADVISRSILESEMPLPSTLLQSLLIRSVGSSACSCAELTRQCHISYEICFGIASFGQGIATL